jgi:hypothetical protein
MSENQDLSEIMNLVSQALREAQLYEIEVEVMASAMQMLQKNPGMDISIALQHGLSEWDL